MSFKEAWARHRLHTALGLAWAAGAWALDPMFLVWSSPVVVGLMLSAPLSMLSARADLGAAAARLGLFTTPEESDPPSLLTRATALRAAYETEARTRAEIARLFVSPPPIATPRPQRRRALAGQGM
jgi:membrane glycosyltransferase